MSNQTIQTPKNREKILEALALHPSKTRACRSARVSRAAFYDWCKQDPEFSQAVEVAREYGIDAIEDALMWDAINHNTTAAIFMLKSWRKERYGDKQQLEHVGKDGQAIEFVYREYGPVEQG